MTPRFALIALLVLAPGAWNSAAAAADRAEAHYTRALARERSVRDASRRATLAQIRSAVAGYEAIVHKFPRSAYCDNALWQAGNLALFAYEQYGQAPDRRASVRLLAHLRSEYPSSSLVARVGEVLQQVDRVRAAHLARADKRPAVVPAALDPVAPAAFERAAPAHSPAATAAALVTIRGITRTPLPGGMRVSIEMDGESTYRSEKLDAPSRVFFDLKGTTAAPGLQDRTLKFTDDVVREIRLGRHPQNTTRIVMDMEGVAEYSVFALYEPFRLVVDFKTSTVAPPVTQIISEPTLVEPLVAPASRPARLPAPIALAPPPAAGPPSALPTTGNSVPSPAPGPRGPEDSIAEPRPTPSAPATGTVTPPSAPSANADGKFSLARQLGLGVSRVVIDAGHGGHDPGAQANGVKEAELVLDVAQRLAKLLQKQTAIEVVMTRDSDIFIPLEQRTAIANREGADLFLSIHANAARNTQARGIETYFLNFASNPEAEAVAARENSASGGKMHSLPEIVRAIALNNKIDESRDFADTVQRAMIQKLSARNKQTRNLGVKQAPFVVLIGAMMPSVLAEISFVTNKQEAQLLKTGAYRQQIAEALFDAILRYQQSLKRMKSTTTLGARQQ
jgi:N-acetylmuramoyl-L-alanine amidase